MYVCNMVFAPWPSSQVHDFQSKIWRYHRIPRPRFHIRRRNFGDSWTFKADTAFFTFAWVFRTSGSKMGVLWGNRGRVGRLWPQRTRSYCWGFTRLCSIWWKSTKKCDRESVHRQTHTHTHTQTQNDIIICPMLYAIAMGQIIRQQHITTIIWDCYKVNCVSCTASLRTAGSCWNKV